jgi:uncharacterized membrane protein YbhN (UPF0104 family)
MHNPRPSTVKPLIFRSRSHGYIALAVNSALLALLSYWLSQNVNLSDLRKYLQQIPTSVIILGMAMNVAVLMCFGARLAAILDAKISPCFLITITGMTFNSLLPFRLGEGVKLYCGGAFFPLPVGGLGAAIVMEKFYDLSMLLLLLATLSANAHLPFVNVGSPHILGLAIAALLCGLLIFWARADGMKDLSRLAVLERFGLNSIAEQAQILLASQKVVFPAFLTLLIWSVNLSLVLYFFRAVAPEIHLGVLDAMTLLVIASLAIAMPVSPAGLGVFEAGIAAYLINVHGLQTEKAISAAALYHFVISLPHSAITAVFFASIFLFRKRA